MVTGASTADLAVILIDARKGVLTQTRRHSYLARLLGIRHVVLAVNKMDLVGYRRRSSTASCAISAHFAAQLELPRHHRIPLSARARRQRDRRKRADALVSGPPRCSSIWKRSRSRRGRTDRPFRMPVQWVNRPNSRFSRLLPAPSPRAGAPGRCGARRCPRAHRHGGAIVTMDGDLPRAVAGQSVTLTLTDEIDVSRGDVLAAAAAPPAVANQFEATIVWMARRAAAAGRAYLLKIGTKTVTATVGAESNTRSTSIPWSIWRPRSWS